MRKYIAIIIASLALFTGPKIWAWKEYRIKNIELYVTN